MIRLIGIYLATGDWASMFREKYATDDSNVYARTLRPQAIITIVSRNFLLMHLVGPQLSILGFQYRRVGFRQLVEWLYGQSHERES